MVIVKATSDSEACVQPSEEMLREMMEVNEELVRAGVLLGGEGLHASPEIKDLERELRESVEKG